MKVKIFFLSESTISDSPKPRLVSPEPVDLPDGLKNLHYRDLNLASLTKTRSEDSSEQEYELQVRRNRLRNCCKNWNLKPLVFKMPIYEKIWKFELLLSFTEQCFVWKWDSRTWFFNWFVVKVILKKNEKKTINENIFVSRK